MTAAGHGAPAWATSRKLDRSGTPTSSQCAKRRWRCVGTQNIVVGRSAVIAAVIAAGSKRPGTTIRPPASSVPVAKRRGAEWCRGLSTRLTSSAQNPHRSRSSATRSAARSGDNRPESTPLGVPVVPLVQCMGRPRGSVRRGSESRATSASRTSTPSVVVTSRSGEMGARIRVRSASVRAGSSGTGKTPRPSRASTRSTYCSDPGTSRATREPSVRSAGVTRPSKQSRSGGAGQAWRGTTWRRRSTGPSSSWSSARLAGPAKWSCRA